MHGASPRKTSLRATAVLGAASSRDLLRAACGAWDERVGLYSYSCDAVIDDILARDRGLSMGPARLVSRGHYASPCGP